MAFHFTEEMKKEFELTIKRAVFDSSEGKLEAVRVSSSTTDHDAKIDDELIGMIKSSKAVIADFTGNRTAVYYEAGFAMGLGIPVIWTCKKADVDNLSFDTRQYPHIIWENEKDLYSQVLNRLKAKIL
jgi:nucleoside 2-deoxyribosyltransferase